MTEKRFQWVYIKDNTLELRDYGIVNVFNNERLEELLNELHDENQLLHEINESTINFMYDNFDSNRIFTNRELNDICNEMGWELSEKGIKIKQLEKENEQLKQYNTELINKIDFLERVIDGDVE